MGVIEVEHLTRDFRQAKRFGGPFGAIRTLVTQQYTTRTALEDLSFAIAPGESVAYRTVTTAAPPVISIS